MAKAKMQDRFDQFMVFSVTQSAADTLTFSTISLGLNIFQYAAIIISRIEYVLQRPALAEFATTADAAELAITGSDSIASLDITQPEVYDRVSYRVVDFGTPASAQIDYSPRVKDFTTMSGGGLIVPAQDMYMAMDSTGFAAAQSASARVYYRVEELAAGDFIELVQRLRVLSS